VGQPLASDAAGAAASDVGLVARREAFVGGEPLAHLGAFPPGSRRGHERAPRPDQQRLDGRLGRAQHVCDLAVRKAAPMTQHERLVLCRGQRVQEQLDPGQLRGRVVRFLVSA
jgi:hypothetical protein